MKINLIFYFLIVSQVSIAQFNLVADLYPGLCSNSTIACGSQPRQLCNFQGKLVFSAIDNLNNNEIVLWQYDELNSPTPIPGSPMYYMDQLSVFDTLLLFSGYDAVNDLELWTFNGIVPPHIVSNINPSGGSQPNDFVEFKNQIYFEANTDLGSELWRYDPLNGISLVKDINTGSFSSMPANFVEFQDSLYFVAQENTVGFELWVTDGISDPHLKFDLAGGSSSSYLTPLISYNNKLICSGFSINEGYELWEFDGLNQPILLADINFGPESSSPWYPILFNNKLYFVANSGINGSDLFVYDGVNAPSLVVHSHSLIKHLIEYDGRLFFNASEGINGNEIWVYDGITQPTLFQDIHIGQEQSSPSDFTIFNNKLYISAFDSLHGFELRVYDAYLSTEEKVKESIKIYPNPTFNYFSIETANCVSGSKLLIADLMGNLVSEHILQNDFVNKIEFDLPKGIYFISLSNGMISSDNYKIVIE